MPAAIRLVPDPGLLVLAHGEKNRAQTLALLGEAVLDAGWDFRERGAQDDSLGFEPAETVDQRARADAAEAGLQLAEASRAVGEFTDELNGPPTPKEPGGAAPGLRQMDAAVGGTFVHSQHLIRLGWPRRQLH